eukprot:gene4164-758_t
MGIQAMQGCVGRLVAFDPHTKYVITANPSINMQSAFASLSGAAGIFTSHGPGLARAVFDDVEAMKDMSSIHFNVAAGVLVTFISGAMGFNPVTLAIATVVAALQ